MFPAESLSGSDGFCVIYIDYLLHSPLNKTFHKCNNMVEIACIINRCQRGRVSDFFKTIFCQKTYCLPYYQENTTICLLQPKFLGRHDLCTNNRCIIFVRFITINNIAFAKNCT